MYQKNNLRTYFLNLRKKKYYEIDKEFFSPLIRLIKSNFKKNSLKIALYYPSGSEINVLKLLENHYMINQNFFTWKNNQVLLVNKLGMLEPVKTTKKIPNLMIVPILAFDRSKYRLGYGKGYYDRYLNKYLKIFKNILTVGVAFSFQKHHKLPRNKNDVGLNYILTEKGIY